MNFELTILGTGSATPVLTRNNTAHYLLIKHKGYLIDCGEGTQFELLRNKIGASWIKYIFITHLHGDHYFGLIGLISTMTMHRRTEDLYIFGPKGLSEILTLQFQHSGTWLNFKIHFVETETEKHYLLFENEDVTVHTIPLVHRVPCCGFLFKEKSRKRNIIKELKPQDITVEQIKALKNSEDLVNEDGTILYSFEKYTTPAPNIISYAFCSDTKFHEPIIDIIRGVDYLYHEATFLHELLPRATQTNHSTAKQAGEIAKAAQVGQLIIGHFSSRYKDVSPLLEEAQTVFPNTILAEDGLVLKFTNLVNEPVLE